MRFRFIALLLGLSTQSAGALGPPKVILGVERAVSDSAALIMGPRIGLITNQTSRVHGGQWDFDFLVQHGVRITALFTPEHGLSGRHDGGAGVSNSALSGIPVFSLYGKTQRPTKAMLDHIDILAFDLQDVGARPYTYVWTMAMAMEEAKKYGKKFVVFDRPNPLGGVVEGPLMEMEMRHRGQAITGYYPVPLRHGLTAGELARYLNQTWIHADLSVVPMSGWHRDMLWRDTGLDWIAPSPNLPTADAALAYSGLVLMEAANVSVGRGTPWPFGVIGAPWVKGRLLADAVNRWHLPGVEVTPAVFVPQGHGEDLMFRGKRCEGVFIKVTDRAKFQPVFTTLVMLRALREENKPKAGIGRMYQMLGSAWAAEGLLAGMDLDLMARRWNTQNTEWMAHIKSALLYN